MNSHDSSTNGPHTPPNPHPPPSRSHLLPPLQPSERLPELPPEEPIYRVDQVAIRKLGGFNFLQVEQWLEMPKDDRMRLIKSGVVTFLNDGQETPLRPALEYLQSLNPPAEVAAPAEVRPSIAPLPRPRPPHPPDGFGATGRPQEA